jgi:hypothetical protein
MIDLATGIFDPQYSREARRSGQRVSLPRHRSQADEVLRALRMAGPLTAHDLERLTGFPLASVCRALCGLRQFTPRIERVGTVVGTMGAKRTLYRAR